MTVVRRDWYLTQYPMTTTWHYVLPEMSPVQLHGKVNRDVTPIGTEAWQCVTKSVTLCFTWDKSCPVALHGKVNRDVTPVRTETWHCVTKSVTLCLTWDESCPIALHGKVDRDVTSVGTDARHNADGPMVDGAPLVLGRGHAPLHAHAVTNLGKKLCCIKSLFF